MPFNEVLRRLNSCQPTAKQQVATPLNSEQGGDQMATLGTMPYPRFSSGWTPHRWEVGHLAQALDQAINRRMHPFRSTLEYSPRLYHFSVLGEQNEVQ